MGVGFSSSGVFAQRGAAAAVRILLGMLAAAALGRAALAQTEPARDQARTGVPTVTIINKAPSASEAPAPSQIAVTPAAAGAPREDARAGRDAPVVAAPPPPPQQQAGPARPGAGAAGTERPPPAADAAAAPPPPTLSIDIDLTRQVMTVVENGAPLHTWPISSARYGYRTPTGTFRPTWMTKIWYSRQYDLAPMPHAIFFHKGVAIHGTYATRALGNPASHGCVRLALANAATLFRLVSRHGKERTQIVVHGTPDHSTAGRVASRGDGGPPDVVRFRRASSYRYLPPSFYGRGYDGARTRLYAAPRHAPRGLYSYGYGF